MCPLHAWQPGQVMCNEHGEGQSDSEAESCTGRVSYVAVLEQSPCIALSLSWLVQDLITFLRVHHGESGIIYARLRSVCSAFLGLKWCSPLRSLVSSLQVPGAAKIQDTLAPLHPALLQAHLTTAGLALQVDL